MNYSSNSSQLNPLRLRAESILVDFDDELNAHFPKDTNTLIHELQVYQIELELQNEDLHETQVALSESRDGYADLFDFAPVSYFMLTAKGTVLAANLTAAGLLDVARDALIDQPFANFVARDNQDLFYLYCLDVLEFPYIQRCELQLVRPDGTHFYAQLEGLAIENKSGDSQEIRLAILDISARKQAERSARERESQLRTIMGLLPYGVLLLDHERRILFANTIAQNYLADLAEYQLNKCLYKLGHEPLAGILARSAEPAPAESNLIEIVWTSPLTEGSTRIFEVQAQLVDLVLDQWILLIDDVTEKRQAEQYLRLQERLASVGQLAAGLAHDFNNILQVITSYAGLLLRQPELSPKTQTRVGHIATQAGSAADLIRQILDYSRTSYQNKQPTDLKGLLSETALLVERTLPEAVELMLDIGSEEATFNVNADASQLEQVLLNLAINAQHAMPDGGTLRFHLSNLTLHPKTRPPSPEMAPGKWVVLQVADSGVGILPAHQDQIFEPFFTTKEVGEGSGLGLSQVYGIVQQHGGTILVDSQLGDGTSFTIYLPAIAAVGLAPAAPTVATNFDGPFGQGQLILLVEDEPAVLEDTMAIVEQLGYTVVTAPNGEEALAVYAQYHSEIALVLTDIAMPVMGGMALAEALHEQETTLNIIGLTGYPLNSDAKAFYSQTITAWLTKPVSIQQLAQAINQFVN